MSTADDSSVIVLGKVRQLNFFQLGSANKGKKILVLYVQGNRTSCCPKVKFEKCYAAFKWALSKTGNTRMGFFKVHAFRFRAV